MSGGLGLRRGRRLERHERHSALRASAGTVLHHLGMHDAGVFLLCAKPCSGGTLSDGGDDAKCRYTRK